MFSDPQSITINSVPVSLPRVALNGRSGVYESADGALVLTISHSNNKRTRSVVRLDRKAIGADALNPSTNKQYTSSAYLVMDYPFTGVDDTTLSNDVKGLLALIQGTGFITRVLGQES